MREPTKVSAYVFPELGNGRIDAQWSRIAEQLPGPRIRTRVSRPLLIAFAAACALAFAWYQRPVANTAESVWEGSVVASDESPVNMTLPEGTLIELDPRSEVALMRSSPEAVHVALSDGSARFEVAKKRSRRFRVQMGAVEVLVTGTQFRVARSVVEGGERVRVDVEEGSVEVHRKGVGAVRLAAGDHWSAFVAKAEQVREEQLEKEGDALPIHSAVTPADQAEPSEPSSLDEGEAEEEDSAPESNGRVTRSARDSAKKAHERAQAAEDLFAQANVARRAGLVTESAKLYAELVARHPRDHKAALAAFELGRLRMDSLSDVPGAVDALERALKLDARRAFAEDALARLVLAHEALGDRAACTRARARYLTRYPEGVHAQHVAARCGGI
jgi:transmembrane sensor